jgi:hypothetical protein
MGQAVGGKNDEYPSKQQRVLIYPPIVNGDNRRGDDGEQGDV